MMIIMLGGARDWKNRDRAEKRKKTRDFHADWVMSESIEFFLTREKGGQANKKQEKKGFYFAEVGVR